MFEAIGSIFSAAAGGGVLGVVGGLLKQVIDWGQEKARAKKDLEILREQNVHEQIMRDKDMALLRLEGETKVRVAEAEGEAKVESARMSAIAQSFASDKASYATGKKASESGWFIAVDVVRGMIRPVLTVALDITVVVVFGLLLYLLSEELVKLFAARDESVTKPMMGLLIEIVKAIIFLAVTATSYWFVARQHAK